MIRLDALALGCALAGCCSHPPAPTPVPPPPAQHARDVQHARPVDAWGEIPPLEHEPSGALPPLVDGPRELEPYLIDLPVEREP